jgi:hypothetical protein
VKSRCLPWSSAALMVATGVLGLATRNWLSEIEEPAAGP